MKDVIPKNNPILISEDAQVGAYESNPVPNEIEPTEGPGYFETIGAGLRADNLPYNVYKSLTSDIQTSQEVEINALSGEEFNPQDPKLLRLASPRHWPELSTSVTKGEFFRRLERTEQEDADRSTQAEGSTWGNLTAGFLNGVSSPTVLFPIARGISTAKMLPGIGSYISKTLPSLAGGFAVDELVLYANQETRTMQEVATNTVVGTVMAGVLGGVAVGAKSLKFNTYKDMISTAAEGKLTKFLYSEDGNLKGFTVHDDSAGSMSVREVLLKNESLYGWGENGELAAAKPFLWATGKWLQNPVVKGLTSKSKTVRGFVNDMYEHNFEIANVLVKGEAMPEALQTKIWTRQNTTFQNEVSLASAYYEYRGLSPDGNFIANTSRSKFRKVQPGEYTQPQFMTEVYKAISDGGAHNNPIVKRESNRIIKDLLKPMYDELVDSKFLEPGLTPFGQIQHVMRMYDRDNIIASRPQKQDFLVSKYNETNEKIKALTAPAESLKAKIANLKEDMVGVTNKVQKVALRKDLESAQKLLKTFEANIQADIKAGKVTRDMLTDGVTKGELKLREVLDHQGLIDAAERTLDTILGLTEEALHSNLSGSLRGGAGGTNPLLARTLMIADKDLIEAGFLQTDIRKNFGAYNLRMSRLIEMEKYARSQGYMGDGPILDFLSNGIHSDYAHVRNKNAALAEEQIKNLTGKALEKAEAKIAKERIKLEKALKDDLNLSKVTYERMMGHSPQQYGAMIRNMRFMKNWAYSTQLGALTLVCLQDALAPVYRQGFVPYFQHGIIPFIKNASKLSKNNARFRQQAMDIGIGIETMQAFTSQKFDLNSNLMMPMNYVERLAENAAKAMGVLNLSSVWSDAFAHIAATSSQSRILRDLVEASAGKLDKKYLQQLLKLGINPNSDVAKRIMQQFKEHGEELSGAYLPNWQLWTDTEAKRVFQGAIKKEVKSTNFNGGALASQPVGVDNNGLSGSMMMYLGWGLNATANYMLPALQKMDTNKATGIAMMMAVSSLVQPLREIADGKEPDLDPANMFKRAIISSGVLGTYGDIFNRINSMGNIIPSMRVDRFKHTRNLFTFAPESLIHDFVSVFGAVANGEMNKTDMKKLQRLVPLTNLIYLRQFMNSLIEDSDLPNNRPKEEGNWR